jgi:hypothetical protein
MATKAELEKLIGKALTDADFRSQLLNDPQAVAQGLGITLSAEEVDRFRSINASQADALAKQFDSAAVAMESNLW